MPARRRGQMLVAMVLLLGLIVMSLLVASYQTHALFLRARGMVVRETVATITADFNRALAAVLAAYTRVCYDPTRFPEAATNFPGLTCDATLAELAAEHFLNKWSDAVRIAYAEYGAQVKWRRGVAEIEDLLPLQPYFIGILNFSWYRSKAGSYAFARLRVNLTTVGFYNWESNSLIGLTVSIEKIGRSEESEDAERPGRGRPGDGGGPGEGERSEESEDAERPGRGRPGDGGGPGEGEQFYDTVRIQVLVNNGTYYGLLLARGWVEVYAYDSSTGSWSKVEIKDVKYDGLGYYEIFLADKLREGTRVRVVASDERGIIVVAEGVAKERE